MLLVSSIWLLQGHAIPRRTFVSTLPPPLAPLPVPPLYPAYDASAVWSDRPRRSLVGVRCRSARRRCSRYRRCTCPSCPRRRRCANPRRFGSSRCYARRRCSRLPCARHHYAHCHHRPRHQRRRCTRPHRTSRRSRHPRRSRCARPRCSPCRRRCWTRISWPHCPLRATYSCPYTISVLFYRTESIHNALTFE